MEELPIEMQPVFLGPHCSGGFYQKWTQAGQIREKFWLAAGDALRDKIRGQDPSKFFQMQKQFVQDACKEALAAEAQREKQQGQDAAAGSAVDQKAATALWATSSALWAQRCVGVVNGAPVPCSAVLRGDACWCSSAVDGRLLVVAAEAWGGCDPDAAAGPRKKQRTAVVGHLLRSLEAEADETEEVEESQTIE
jgi:hypothetical protein